MQPTSTEHLRLKQANTVAEPWKRWGPYLSERQWGTVREDYSPEGHAWDYLPHDHARSKTYRWGEDGLLGICDDAQKFCFSIALWNGKDAILKERLFGLSNGQGNHGEDVKELYYYLDATPTHSYLKGLYKYPQAAYPYTKLIEENARRGRNDPEFELLDTGIFDDDRYYDVFVEYAQATPEDILVMITVHNRGPDQATLHVLPQIWFRNTWSWKENATRPEMRVDQGVVIAEVNKKNTYHVAFEGHPTLLFCENETNRKRHYGLEEPGFFKDAFHDYVVHGQSSAVNPAQVGTKAAGHYVLNLAPGESKTIRVRLTKDGIAQPWQQFDQIFAKRQREADEYYAALQHEIADEDVRLVQRQAFAGLIWSKQFYYFDIPQWLKGDPTQPAPPGERRYGRNSEWEHLNNADIISMPDKWEYPWYAAWDLAFHCIPFALIDAEFAKEQLLLLTREWYMHPNGQLPAYEWNFGDVNPPVHAWATWRVFQIDRKQRGDTGDLAFLERVFHKLMLNFTWWVNRKDAQGRNIFQGGFLGLDNIGVFDRSSPLPTGGHINQADGTSWMAMYCLNLMRIALELAMHNHVYEDIATKFFEHFLHIAEAMTNIGGDGHGESLWDEEDQFYYDQLNLPHGQKIKLKVRSMVGLIPLFAVEVLDPECLAKLPLFERRLKWFLNNRPDLARLVSRWSEPGRGDRHLLSLLRGHRMKELLKRMLDESEFLSEYGIRALSKVHQEHPYTFWTEESPLTVAYVPGDSDSGLFGGNSNWRGPIWFPVNYLIIESLQRFHYYYGDDFKIECPTGSGRYLTIDGVANELTQRLSKLFLRNDQGHRPLFGDDDKLQRDRHFRDYLLFPEYFHGDTGRAVGASHQTGWTALIAKLLTPRKCEAHDEAGHRQQHKDFVVPTKPSVDLKNSLQGVAP